MLTTVTAVGDVLPAGVSVMTLVVRSVVEGGAEDAVVVETASVVEVGVTVVVDGLGLELDVEVEEVVVDVDVDVGVVEVEVDVDEEVEDDVVVALAACEGDEDESSVDETTVGVLAGWHEAEGKRERSEAEHTGGVCRHGDDERRSGDGMYREPGL